MKKDSDALVSLLSEPPLRRINHIIQEEIARLIRGKFWIEPARGIEPEDRFVSVYAKLSDGFLGGLLELAAKGAHDEDRDGAGHVAWDDARGA